MQGRGDRGSKRWGPRRRSAYAPYSPPRCPANNQSAKPADRTSHRSSLVVRARARARAVVVSKRAARRKRKTAGQKVGKRYWAGERRPRARAGYYLLSSGRSASAAWRRGRAPAAGTAGVRAAMRTGAEATTAQAKNAKHPDVVEKNRVMRFVSSMRAVVASGRAYRAICFSFLWPIRRMLERAGNPTVLVRRRVTCDWWVSIVFSGVCLHEFLG